MSRLSLLAALLILLGAAGPAEPDDPCRAIRRELETQGLRSFEKHGPERRLGRLCGYRDLRCQGTPDEIPLTKLTDRGVNLREAKLAYLLEERSFIQVTEIDVNNDGLPDLRLSRIVGSASCQKNYFFLRTPEGSYVYKTFNEFDPLTTEGGFCGADYLTTRRIDGVTYLVVASEFQSVVFRPEPSGSLARVCAFAPKEKWTAAQETIADLVRRKYPDMLVDREMQRPELEVLEYDERPFARKGETVWAVAVRCKDSGRAYAVFLVHPLRKDIRPIIVNDVCR